MQQGTVKWFNAKKVMDSFQMQKEMTYLFIFPHYRWMDSKSSKMAKKLSLK